jgi:hypothetical protein
MIVYFYTVHPKTICIQKPRVENESDRGTGQCDCGGSIMFVCESLISMRRQVVGVFNSG